MTGFYDGNVSRNVYFQQNTNLDMHEGDIITVHGSFAIRMPIRIHM